VAVTDALGNTSTRSYDAFGRLASESDALGNTTLYAYDALDRLVRVTTGANVPGAVLATAYTYDAIGRKLTMQLDPDGLKLTTQYRYTRPGSSDTWSLQEVVDAKGNVTAYSYNSLGALANTTDAQGQTWSYTYDNLGRQTAHSDPLRRTTIYAVDALGPAHRADAGRAHGAVGVSTGRDAGRLHGLCRARDHLRLRPGQTADRHRLPGRHGGCELQL
jgi:YD repeat-containing protein